MLRSVALTLMFLTAAGAAVAHPGHIGELAGHNHWIAGAAVGLAAAIALWAGLRRRKARRDPAVKAKRAGDAKETSKT